MGISQGGTGIDCSVGAIVWVRRRNGSWWPGRILGSEELSVSHLMSPRSGTPVKLLGREDASVDWYNLEKSKRVKAFRCGEFDECIERAESSQGAPIKKREKYARREDAILHALELEREHLEKRRQMFGIGINCLNYKMLDDSNKNLEISCLPESFLANDEARDNCRLDNFKSHTFCKRPVSSLEEGVMAQLSYSKPTYDNDNSEIIPRMRGLQDLGLNISSSKRKHPASFPCFSNSETVLAGNYLYPPPGGGNNLNDINGAISIRKKRSQGGLAEETLARRRDRRRPLVQVLQCSTKLPLSNVIQSDRDEISPTIHLGKEQMGIIYEEGNTCVYSQVKSNNYLDHEGFPPNQLRMSPSHFGMDTSFLHPGSLTEEYTSSGLIEEQESGSSLGEYMNHVMEDKGALLSDPANQGNGHVGSISQVPLEAGNMDSEEFGESELSSHASQHHPDEQAAGITYDIGGSKWQLKGKRNIRNLTKKPVEAVDNKGYVEKNCNGANDEYCEDMGNANQTETVANHGSFVQQDMRMSKDLSSKYDESVPIESDMAQTCTLQFGNKKYSKYPSMLKLTALYEERNENNSISSDEDSHVFSSSMWDADRLSQATLRGYWQESDGCLDRAYFGNFGDPMLVDVDLKVQASYHGERVPLVSLMSRLNGKAIVGHPVQVETMESGSSSLLIPREDYCEERHDADGNAALPPVWRTARRTVMHRIPRPHLVLEEEEASMFQCSDSDHERNHLSNKPFAGHVKNKMKMKGIFPDKSRPPMQKQLSKKLVKRINLSNQKTRTLSSIAIEQKHSRKNDRPTLTDRNIGLCSPIKADGCAPVVACVPVKLVFSRIWEAIGRPSSNHVNQGFLNAGHEGSQLQ